MARLFIAACLPEDAKDRLLAMQPAPLSGMRLTGRQELHLTLHFLGEIADDQAGVVQQALRAVKGDAFIITLKGIGQFPPEGPPKVVWAGVETSPALIALHQSVGAVLSDAIGSRPEDRPYSPHVTLAYLNIAPPPGVIEQHIEENRAFHVPDVLINEFALLSSVVVDNVPRYSALGVFQLLEAEQQR